MEKTKVINEIRDICNEIKLHVNPAILAEIELEQLQGFRDKLKRFMNGDF